MKYPSLDQFIKNNFDFRDKNAMDQSFELIAFDFVSNPSTKGAFMFPSGEQSLQEGVVKNPLTNKWEKVEDLIRDILGEIK